jgi:hypothetical protein
MGSAGLANDPLSRTRDALTELHLYALVLDGERELIEQRIAELDRDGGQPRELRDLHRRRAEITAQLELLHRTITGLRAAVDPSGQNL